MLGGGKIVRSVEGRKKYAVLVTARMGVFGYQVGSNELGIHGVPSLKE